MNPETRDEAIGYRGFYRERSGENARLLAEFLIEPPEVLLNDEEFSEAYTFEHELFSHSIEPDVTTESIIREHISEDTEQPLVFARAFVEGEVDLAGLPEEMRPGVFGSYEDAYKWFIWLTTKSEVDKTLLVSLAKQSGESYRRRVADALVAGESSINETKIDMMSIVLDADKALTIARHDGELRSYLQELRQIHSENNGTLDGAKRAILDVYLARVNGMCVGSIITMGTLAAQARLFGNEDMASRAEDTLSPELTRALSKNSAEKRERVLKRLNYLIAGAGENAEGKMNAVSRLLYDAIEKRSGIKGGEALFTPEQTEILKHTMIAPEQMKRIFENTLHRASLLSLEDASTWSPQRRHRAADGLFQVVENPGKNSFAVNGISGVYMYASKPRSLYDVMVVGGIHEMTHINQVQSDLALGESLKLATLKGRRPGMLREGGANARQRQAEQQLFGESKPIALTYAKAYETLHATNSVYASAQAFFNEKRRVMPKVDIAKAADEAADRVLRLQRSGGYSSGALEYAEEAILDEELEGAPEAVISRASAVTSFDLVDQVKLHKYGLLVTSAESAVDWAGLILEEVKPYIEAALSGETSEA